MTNSRDSAVQQTLLQLNARAWGISFGILLGGALFLATAVLLLKGGPMVGQHLQLLRSFFPGYSVSWLGAFIGFVYGFVLGYALGRLIGEVYNRLTVR
jgi:hypothetical protein